MKKYLKWGVALLCANLALVSCEDDNDTLNDDRNPKPVLTVSDVTPSGVEGDDITFTVTSDMPISRDIDLKLEVVNGESVATFRDFFSDGEETTIDGGGYGQGQLGYLLTFPAYATSHTFTISLERDLLIEGTENLELYLRSGGNGLGLIAPGSERLSIAISDFVSNDVAVSLDWSGDSYDAFGSLVDGDFHDYDFDIYVFNDNFDEVTGYAGATSALPEMVELTSDLPDGDYLVLVDFYAKPAAASLPAIPVAIPAMLTVSKYGVWSETIMLDFMTSSPVSGGGGLGAGYITAATIRKVGNTYTLYAGEDTDGPILASGRISELSNLVGARK